MTTKTPPPPRVLTAARYRTALDAAFEGREDARPWYWKLFGIRPRAFTMPDTGQVYVRHGHEHDADLLAHEYGHAVGLDHAAWYEFDVMSGTPPRLADKHALRPRAAEWARGLHEDPA